jgi:hypothetical protein
MIFTPTLKQKVRGESLVVPREALKPRYEQWIKTSADYLIRARTNIGLEWNLGLVTEALKKEGARKGNNSHVGRLLLSSNIAEPAAWTVRALDFQTVNEKDWGQR